MWWVLVSAAVLHALMTLWLVKGAKRKPAPLPLPTAPISVIIAAHNEASNLAAHLPSWLGQDHAGEWELIVVLDRCTDGSKAVLESFQKDNPRLRVEEVHALPPGWSPKKHALDRGMTIAKHQRFAFTDADCELEAGWLRGIDAAFCQGADLVLGIGALRSSPGLLNALARFETWMTAILYTGLAGRGLPYMGVGRNMAYTRAFFAQAGGFASHQNRLSGDDDLLVNSAGPGSRVQVMLEPGTHSWSNAPRTWKAWRQQKLRHHSAAPAYRWRSKLILVGFHGLHAIFYLSLILVLFCSADPAWVAVVWGCRAVFSVYMWELTGWQNRNDLLLISPLLDFMYLLYLIVIGPAGMVLPPKWKGK